MLKKLSYAARKLILITTLMALVATATSCGSDDESATESRTRNFSASLDCEARFAETTMPMGMGMPMPMPQTVDEGLQEADDAYYVWQEYEDEAYYLEDQLIYLETVFDDTYTDWQMNGSPEEVWPELSSAQDDYELGQISMHRHYGMMGEAEDYYADLVDHVIQIGGETGRNSSADAERDACREQENQMYGDWEAEEAQLELDELERDQAFINNQINAAAQAADKLEDFEVVEDAADEFAAALEAFREVQESGDRGDAYREAYDAKNDAADRVLSALDNGPLGLDRFKTSGTDKTSDNLDEVFLRNFANDLEEVEAAAADAAAQAQAEAQAAADAAAQAALDAAAGDDENTNVVVSVDAVPASAGDDTNVSVPPSVILISSPVVVEVEEVVDEIVFNKNTINGLLTGAGVAAGSVEVKTNSGDWQTLDQDATNSLPLGTNDEEVEIRVTSNDSEPVIVEKVIEIVRVETAAGITPEQLAMLLPVASTTSGSSNSTLPIVIVIAVLIALVAAMVLRKKKS
jgi:hypothetical protein